VRRDDLDLDFRGAAELAGGGVEVHDPDDPHALAGLLVAGLVVRLVAPIEVDRGIHTQAEHPDGNT
jgi:hypothetical protein